MIFKVLSVYASRSTVSDIDSNSVTGSTPSPPTTPGASLAAAATELGAAAAVGLPVDPKPAEEDNDG